MKLDEFLATTQEVMLANGVSKETVAKTIRDIQRRAEEEKEDRKQTAGKKAKTAFHILVTDPEGKLAGLSLVGFIVQTEEDCPPQDAYTRIVAASNTFNSTKRGRKAPLETLGDAMQVLRGRALKQDQPDRKIAIKTHQPVAVQAVPNQLPK